MDNDFSHLNSEEKGKLCLAAYNKLCPEDKLVINTLAKRLIHNYHRRLVRLNKTRPNSGFGFIAALEVLSMMGVAIIDGRLRVVKR